MKAREIMTEGAEVISADATISEAAERLARDDVGALPVCGPDGRLQAMITDRDIVVNVIAQSKDPQSTRVGDVIPDTEVVTIGADDLSGRPSRR